jgi:glutathione S-transferase
VPISLIHRKIARERFVIHLYGSPQNRAFRSFWMLEELGLEYQSTPLDTQSGETRTPEFLKINPNGHVPTLVDGELVVWESMAINLYLAKKYGGDLATDSLAAEAASYAWSFWVMTEVEPNLLAYGMNTQFLPEKDRDPKLAEKAGATLEGAMGVLDGELDGKPYLSGDRFRVTDLNVAAVLSWAALMSYDLSRYENVERWLGTCLGRPAAQRVQAMGAGS